MKNIFINSLYDVSSALSESVLTDTIRYTLLAQIIPIHSTVFVILIESGKTAKAHVLFFVSGLRKVYSPKASYLPYWTTSPLFITH